MTRRAFPFLILAFAALVAGCSVPGPGEAPDGVHDPYEVTNRQVHAFNVGLDRAVLRPASRGYVTVAPSPLREGLSNLADFASTPRSVANQLLQGRFVDAGRNTLRFTTNAIVGLGGILDPAASVGLTSNESGFGETLRVWGVPEGAFVMLPLLGPSTERDSVGEVVDLALNPLDLIVPQTTYRRVATGARVADMLNERGELAGAIDEVLYESADSYSQLRLIYLQTRRFELGEDVPPESVDEDPLALDTEGF
jgi:phospholipid-binding lipoprotein MlaA